MKKLKAYREENAALRRRVISLDDHNEQMVNRVIQADAEKTSLKRKYEETLEAARVMDGIAKKAKEDAALWKSLAQEREMKLEFLTSIILRGLEGKKEGK